MRHAMTTTSTTTDDDDATGWKAAEELIGCVEKAPPDVAENHDEYLHDLPRR